MGAWIEIHTHHPLFTTLCVAPLVGAWIEIMHMPCSYIGLIPVAPLVGAWIEIVYSVNGDLYKQGRSPRGSVD